MWEGGGPSLHFLLSWLCWDCAPTHCHLVSPQQQQCVYIFDHCKWLGVNKWFEIILHLGRHCRISENTTGIKDKWPRIQPWHCNHLSSLKMPCAKWEWCQPVVRSIEGNELAGIANCKYSTYWKWFSHHCLCPSVCLMWAISSYGIKI